MTPDRRAASSLEPSANVYRPNVVLLSRIQAIGGGAQHDPHDVGDADDGLVHEERLEAWLRRLEVDRTNVREHLRQAERDVEHAQRGDERRQLGLRDEAAVDDADQGSGPECGEQPERQRQAEADGDEACHDRAQGHGRPDRQVDAAGDDHQGDADREHAIDRGCGQDVDVVIRAREVRNGDREEDEQDDQRAEGQQPLDRLPGHERPNARGCRGGGLHQIAPTGLTTAVRGFMRRPPSRAASRAS